MKNHKVDIVREYGQLNSLLGLALLNVYKEVKMIRCHLNKSQLSQLKNYSQGALDYPPSTTSWKNVTCLNCLKRKSKRS